MRLNAAHVLPLLQTVMAVSHAQTTLHVLSVKVDTWDIQMDKTLIFYSILIGQDCKIQMDF